jgi:murein DD-endopeptidase MepM/ murein hydrolase activator NlpD
MNPIRSARDGAAILPLPRGEGWGEGEERTGLDVCPTTALRPLCAFLRLINPRPPRALKFLLLLVTGLLATVPPLVAQPFRLPTANHALFEPGGEERFFVGTVGKSWTSGMFGCVRTEGWQMHEGLDIRCLQRDKRGEPVDPVLAAADGTVAYINTRPSLSNYGNYVVLRHEIEGIEIHTLYAHLREVRAGLAPGQTVKAGEAIAVMGRTSNTKEGISRERAHVHFEIDFVLSDRFPQWFRKTNPTQRNDHGAWNGQNLLGLDPRLLLLAQQKQGAKFSLVEFIRAETELCRVLVSGAQLAWARRHPMLIKPNPVAEKEGIAGYELALNFNGLPFEILPRAASEIRSKSKFLLLSVNAAERQSRPCGRIVTKDKSGRWQLAPRGQQLLELLTF